MNWPAWPSQLVYTCTLVYVYVYLHLGLLCVNDFYTGRSLHVHIHVLYHRVRIPYIRMHKMHEVQHTCISHGWMFELQLLELLGDSAKKCFLYFIYHTMPCEMLPVSSHCFWNVLLGCVNRVWCTCTSGCVVLLCVAAMLPLFMGHNQFLIFGKPW